MCTEEIKREIFFPSRVWGNNRANPLFNSSQTHLFSTAMANIQTHVNALGCSFSGPGRLWEFPPGCVVLMSLYNRPSACMALLGCSESVGKLHNILHQSTKIALWWKQGHEMLEFPNSQLPAALLLAPSPSPFVTTLSRRAGAPQ